MTATATVVEPRRQFTNTTHHSQTTINLINPPSTKPPTMALVRDPYFWKRFSTAVHLDEEAKSASTLDLECTQQKYSPSPVSILNRRLTYDREPDSWLEREQRKRKRSLIWGFVIFFTIVLLVIGGVVVWWLSQHHWLQRPEP